MSKTGVQVVPELTVFHTPPEATPTKYFAGFFGSTAKPMTRPEVKAGPMERMRKPLKVGVDIGSRGVGDGDASGVGLGLPLGDATGLGEGCGPAGGSCPSAVKEKSNNEINRRAHVDRVISGFLFNCVKQLWYVSGDTHYADLKNWIVRCQASAAA